MHDQPPYATEAPHEEELLSEQIAPTHEGQTVTPTVRQDGRVTRYFCEYDDPRLMAIAYKIDDLGGTMMLTLDQLKEELDMPAQAIIRRTKWGEQYGLWSVTRTSGGFGVGRTPNRYDLLMSIDEWMKQGPKIVAEVHRDIYKARSTRKRKGPKPVPPVRVPPQVDEAWARVQEQAKAEVEAAIEAGKGLPKVKLPRISAAEVEAFAAFAAAERD